MAREHELARAAVGELVADGAAARKLTQGVSGDATKEQAWGALLVGKGWGIPRRDLEGRTVAINTINNVPHTDGRAVRDQRRERFTRAMNRSLEYAATHPDEVRRIVTTHNEIPEEAAANMKLPVWKADMNVPTIELTARLSREDGLLEKEPDLVTLIHEAGERGTSWDMVLEPCEASELHRHANHYLFIYVTDDDELEIAPPGQDAFRQRCADGQTAYWKLGAEPGPADTHTLRNVGTRTHRQILVELRGPSRPQESTARPETNGRCE